jgi:hypothetical protein
MKPQSLSPEERAELHRELEEVFFGRRGQRRRPKFVLVCLEGQVVGDATVNVGIDDPNFRIGGVKVRK